MFRERAYMRLSTDNELHLIGRGLPTISFLKREQWGEEATQQVFQGAIWMFRPDGTFIFTRSAVANFRDYLIEGVYTQADTIIEFHGEAGSTSLDGVLHLQENTIQLQALYAIQAKKVVGVVQTLSQYSRAVAHMHQVNIGGFQIPTIYRLSLSGKVDEHTFGPLPGTLDLLPATGKDPGPFLVQLATDSLTDIGHLYWTTFIYFLDGGGTLESTIVLTGNGQARLEVAQGHSLMGPSWSTISREETIQGKAGPIAAVIGGLSLPVAAETCFALTGEWS
jgi:hypothetical protein